MASAAKLGEEPDVYKILVYSQLSVDEVSKANLPIEKLIYWDVTASLPGKSAVDAPHVTVYWYGPNVSAVDRGKVVRVKSVKLDPKYSESILSIVRSKVGGNVSQKENAIVFTNFTMRTGYDSIVDLAKSIEKLGNLSVEISLEYGKVTKQEKNGSSFPKAKILGEKALEEK